MKKKKFTESQIVKIQNIQPGKPVQNAVQRRTFERRFKKSTGNSVSEYIQRVKVEAVKKQLEIGCKIINEIVYEVGYNDINAFRDVFKKYVGLSPVEDRRKFTICVKI